MIGRFLVFFLIITAIEVYFLQAVRALAVDFSPGRRNYVLYTAYGLAVVSFVVGIISMIIPPSEWNLTLRYISAFVLILALCKLLGVSFLIIDDLLRVIRWLLSAVTHTIREGSPMPGEPVSRVKFFSQLALTFTVVPAIGFLYGMVRGAYKYRVHKVRVNSPNVPEAFHGFKILQVSDIHTGSFMNTNALEKAFGIAMEQGADLIAFTGDLVNNLAEETDNFLEVFKKLKAPYGVYSVLGNHDYGDYVKWDSDTAKQANLKRMKAVHSEVGWRLLMNEHVAIEKGGQKIAVMGIENWGANMHFPKYGKMNEAYQGAEQYPFKVLLSHDPSHWEKQVRQEYPDVDLTLSGHTHGMQMGIEIPGFKWSPVKYFYKFWAGMYRQGNQYLYVNRGLGFLGYPGRLGIWPEITVLELQRA